MHPEPRVFISYSREDAEFADALSRALSERGIEVWMDRNEIHAGDDWVLVTERAMAASDLILLLLSREYSLEGFANYERALATKLATESSHIRVVPVLVPGASWDQVPLALQRYQVVRGDAPLDAVADQIRGIVAAHISK
jgi:hypothetical protein